jgi:IclR helix-turn-helix domain
MSRIEAPVANRTEPEIWVPISIAQAARLIQQVVGAKGPGVSLIRVLLAFGGQDRVAMADLRVDPEFDDRKISQSLIVGLLVLTSFYEDTKQTVTAISTDIGQPPSTTIRYLKTWVAVGILEQDPTDRSYRLARRWREELAAAEPPTSLPST